MEGLRLVEKTRAEQAAREGNEREILGWVHFGHVLLAVVTGEVAGTLARAHQSLEIALAIGSTFSRVDAYWTLGRAHAMHGEWDESVKAVEEGLVLARSQRTAMQTEAAALTGLAEAYLGRGDLGRARAMAEEAVEVARRCALVVNEPEAQVVLARVLLRGEGVAAQDAIRAALERALTLAREIGAKVREPAVHLELAELAQLVGDHAARERELGEARRLLIEMGMVTRAAKVERRLAGLSP